jgi:5'-nucleotidase
MRIKPLAVAALLATQVGAAFALNILLTNDDGFEAANLRALSERLRAAGHVVVISAPTQNNSGRGGFVEFLRPVTPLTRDTRHATVKAGAPGVGVDPVDPKAFYVDGTPVASLLYGLDVASPKFFAGPPDLVISGPNEGNNTGLVNNSSGTVANALYAINRGIPAIAVSDSRTSGRPYAQLAHGDIEYEVADIVVELVGVLDKNRRKHRELLPEGSGLNVNIPPFTAGNGQSLPFAFTRMGVATAFSPVFFERLSDSALARSAGVNLPLPGISLVSPLEVAPPGVVLPADTRPSSENNRLGTGAVTLTVIQGIPQADRLLEALTRHRLEKLVRSPHHERD